MIHSRREAADRNVCATDGTGSLLFVPSLQPFSCCARLVVGMNRRDTQAAFTAVIQKRGRWYVAYVEEIPGVNTQGHTLAEARRNLRDALRLVLDAHRQLAARESRGTGVRRDSIYCNPSNRRTSSVPRHSEINDFLARKICRDLDIPEPH